MKKNTVIIRSINYKTQVFIRRIKYFKSQEIPANNFACEFFEQEKLRVTVNKF